MGWWWGGFDMAAAATLCSPASYLWLGQGERKSTVSDRAGAARTRNSCLKITKSKNTADLVRVVFTPPHKASSPPGPPLPITLTWLPIHQ